MMGVFSVTLRTHVCFQNSDQRSVCWVTAEYSPVVVVVHILVQWYRWALHRLCVHLQLVLWMIHSSYSSIIHVSKPSWHRTRKWTTTVPAWCFQQCFFFGRKFGQVTPKNIYFHYLKTKIPDQSIQKITLFYFEKKSTGFQLRGSIVTGPAPFS